MTGCLSNHYYSLKIDEYGKKIFSMAKSGNVVFCLLPLYEFAIQIESEEYSGIITSDACAMEFSVEGNRYEAVYHHGLFDMNVCYFIEEEAVYKTMSFRAKKDLTIRYAQTEVSKTNAALSRGGEGQPIFLADAAFISIIFPAAQNMIDQDIIRLEQAPFVTLSTGESFGFFPIIYGFNTEGTLEETFLQYIVHHKKKTPLGLKIYGDWGAHDELAGEGELNEKMALRLLSGLVKGKEYGADFDYYLMDAFWFEASGLYLNFRESAWPEGADRFLAELKKARMKFGLWFDVNMEKLKLPEGVTGREGAGGGLCLAYEENTKLLFNGIRRQIRQCGCRMLKLDFAFFDCQDESHGVHASEKIRSKEPAIRNFLKELTSLCEENAGLLVLGYNGFTTDLEGIAAIDPRHTDLIISPWWCLYLDYLYCGDPRPAELPTENLGNSLICYTDSMLGRFAKSLIPYCAIDDHGTMIGNTNTIYYLGKGSFQDSWIMNIVRGGKKLHLYGELELMRDEDWRFIGESNALFEFVCRTDVRTERIGKSPAKGEVYGYSNSDGKRGYLTLVNPRNTEEMDFVRLEEWEGEEEVRIRKYYGREGFLRKDYEQFGEGLPVSLCPFEIVVYEWEKKARKNAWKEGYLILEGKSRELLTFPSACTSFSIQFMDEYFSPLRLIGRGEELFWLECLNENRGLKRLHTNPIWSGCSWLMYQIIGDSDGVEKTVVRLHNDSDSCLYIKWRNGGQDGS